MATDIGKAYVQIVPSAQGIAGSISKALKGESDSAGKQSGNSLIGGIKKVLTGAAIGETLKKTITEGANLEQSIGGIETLFNGVEDRMFEFADQASRTAGLSANDYMQTVTSFAASLKQSTGGDLQALDDISNQAVIDMADNANKMGTDMASIQNAYQGFAKQNYTMLDNLKLGYGGTKNEMQRLLKDAQKISGVKYDINNLSDVYSAIHVIQNELGITGTTAEEAAHTISGSFNMLKASASNLMGNLALGNDLAPYFADLLNSVVTFGQNIVPAIGNVFSGIANTLVSDAIPMATQWISSLGDGIIGGIPRLVGRGLSAILQFTTALRANLGEMISVGMDLLSNLAQGIVNAIPTLVRYSEQIIKNIIGFIGDNLPVVLEKGRDIVITLMQGLIAAAPTIFAAMGRILQTLWQTVKNIDWISLGVSIVAGVGTGIVSLIGVAVSAMASVAKEVWNAIKSTNWLELGSNIVNGMVNGIKSGIGAVASAAKELATSAWNAITGFLGISSPAKKLIYVGKMSDKGLAKGLIDNISVVKNAMRDVSDQMVSSFMPDLNAQMHVGNGYNSARGSGSGYTQIINNYSPKALSPSETARMTRNATRQMALKLSMGG